MFLNQNGLLLFVGRAWRDRTKGKTLLRKVSLKKCDVTSRLLQNSFSFFDMQNVAIKQYVGKFFKSLKSESENQ